MGPARCGADWWLAEPESVLIRIAKTGEPERFLRARPEDLQRVMDKAALEFADRARAVTKPCPDPKLEPKPKPKPEPRRRR